MKKLLIGLALVGSVFMFSGCDSSDYLTDEEKVVLLSEIYPDIFESIKGDDGDSAYQVAVNEGYEGTVEEWLQSLVGADGEDGVCPDCNVTTPVEPVECPNPFELDEGDMDVHVKIWTNRKDLEEYAFFRADIVEGLPQSVTYTQPTDIPPFMIEDENGTTILSGLYSFETPDQQTWGIGLQFDQFVPVVTPQEDEDDEDEDDTES